MAVRLLASVAILLAPVVTWTAIGRMTMEETNEVYRQGRIDPIGDGESAPLVLSSARKRLRAKVAKPA